MAQVFEISVERSRTAQVKDYEPSSAKVSLKASLEEGEDWKKVTEELLNGAREQVYSSLNLKLPAQSGQESTTSTSSSGSSGKGGSKSGNKGGSKSNKSNKSNDTDKGEDADKAAQETSDKSKNNNSNDDADIPDDDNKQDEASADTGEETSGGDKVSQQDLTDLVTESITNKKITTAKVKEILGNFNATRVRDLEESNYAAFKKEIESNLKG